MIADGCCFTTVGTESITNRADASWRHLPKCMPNRKSPPEPAKGFAANHTNLHSTMQRRPQVAPQPELFQEFFLGPTPRAPIGMNPRRSLPSGGTSESQAFGIIPTWKLGFGHDIPCHSASQHVEGFVQWRLVLRAIATELCPCRQQGMSTTTGAHHDKAGAHVAIVFFDRLEVWLIIHKNNGFGSRGYDPKWVFQQCGIRIYPYSAEIPPDQFTQIVWPRAPVEFSGVKRSRLVRSPAKRSAKCR